MELNLKGKTALVTGASKGIGLGVAETLAAEGVHLHIAARTAADLAAAKQRIESAHGVKVTVHPADLSQSSTVRELARACQDVDILVNNAGAIPGGSLESIDEETWRAAWDLKVFGYINLTREVLRAMRARGSGTIVNVIGLAGERPSEGYIAGAAGNASLMAFTRGLGAKSLDYGVRVVAVNPGPVGTDRNVYLNKIRAKNELGDENRWQEYYKTMPMGRAATVKEIADTVVFLASPLASYITGTVVTVDGGIGARTS